MYTEAYKKLERSLTDNIAEAQAKLGYRKIQCSSTIHSVL